MVTLPDMGVAGGHVQRRKTAHCILESDRPAGGLQQEHANTHGAPIGGASFAQLAKARQRPAELSLDAPDALAWPWKRWGCLRRRADSAPRFRSSGVEFSALASSEFLRSVLAG